MAENSWQSCINQCAPDGGSGGRLVITPDPDFGPGPVFTYTLAADEAVPFFGGPPLSSLELTLPPIGSLTPGQECGLYLPIGNPLASVTFIPDAADVFIDPLTNVPSGPPGTPMVYPPGTFPAGARISWQGVLAPSLAWFPQWDQGTLTAGGGGAGSYEATLAIGQDSGVLGRYLNQGSRAVMGTDVFSSPTPGVASGGFEAYQYEGSYLFSSVSGGGEGAGTYQKSIDIFENTNASLFDGVVILEWWVFRYASSGFSPPTFRGYATAKETWNIGAATARIGAQRIPDIVAFSGFDCARISVGSSLRSIAMEILDGPTAGPPLSAKVYFKVTFSNNTSAF